MADKLLKWAAEIDADMQRLINTAPQDRDPPWSAG